MRSMYHPLEQKYLQRALEVTNGLMLQNSANSVGKEGHGSHL